MPARLGNFLIFVPIIFIISACSDVDESNEVDKLSSLDNVIQERKIKSRPLPNPIKNAYFGDLHVHTENSFDAYTFGTIATPADAYKYAQGQSILHPTGYQIQLRRPLDFYSVTDHGIFLGLLTEAADTNSEFSKYKISEPLHNLNDSVSNSFFSIVKRNGLFRDFGEKIRKGLNDGTIDESLVAEVGKTVWHETIKAADEAYKPGMFTTFAGYEYTSSEEMYENYFHRNVIFRDTKNLPKTLFTRADSMNPEKLWEWMNRLRDNGVESLAIPHNSNISGGVGFPLNDFNGGPIDEEYTKNRKLNEPLVEITQAKGTSETHPFFI